jgi:ABC-type dipeptide/oligopeptide/nickel transport system permease subunit
MATIAQPGVHTPPDLAWELPAQKPLLVRVARPWLRNPMGLFGLILAAIFIFLGVFGPWLAPLDPRAFDVFEKNAGPSGEHLFGTNALGQDVFSRILHGARLSFQFGALVMLFGFVPGTVLGIMSGYFGRWIDYLIQRSAEAWTALPQLPILLTVVAAVGPGLKAVVVVVAIGALFGGSRLLRAVALVEKHKDYVLAARALGCGETHILIRHVIPNIMPFILIGASSVFAVAVLAEAALSFLGLGAQVGTPGWGIDLAEGAREGGTQYPHLVIFPGIAISLVVLGFNLLGDTLRDILDPRLRGST